MSVIIKNHTFSAGATIVASEHNSNFDTIYADYNSNITNANCSASMGLVDTKLAQITTANKVHGTAITGLASLVSGAGVIPAANLPSSGPPTDYRNEMYVTRTASTTMSVGLGLVEINATSVAKITDTTLTITTAGDWAGGSSLQAVSTYGYVGIDTSGNLKMHTTIPSHSNFAVSRTTGTRRYATWSGTVYRIIGWFYMNATGSGELDTYAVSNLKDGNVQNHVHRVGSTDDTVNDTAYGTDLTEMVVRIYTTGQRPVVVVCKVRSSNNIDNGMTIMADFDGTDDLDSEASLNNAATTPGSITLHYIKTGLTQGTHTITIQAIVAASSDVIDSNKILDVYEM